MERGRTGREERARTARVVKVAQVLQLEEHLEELIRVMVKEESVTSPKVAVRIVHHHHPPGKHKLPDDALVDELGRPLCYANVNRKCNDPNCKRYHGPETKAMHEKRLKDEKRMAERAEKAAAAGGERPGPRRPKVKAKAPPATPADDSDHE